MQLIEISRGLDYLHSRGVIHGNLKQVGNPSECMAFSCVVLMKRVKKNILVDSAGHVRLSDIGFAKLIPTEESRFDWARVGATGCRWTAPEIFRKGELTKQSDIFTYGFISAEVHLPDRCSVTP